MEPTYYWDSLDAEVLDWLAANTTDTEKVLFGLRLHRKPRPLCEPGARFPLNIAPTLPALTVGTSSNAAPAPACRPTSGSSRTPSPSTRSTCTRTAPAPGNSNVPLLEIYPYEDYEAAAKSLEQE